MMNLGIGVSLTILTLLLGPVGEAAPPEPAGDSSLAPPPTVQVPRVEQGPTIDGRIGKTEWAGAARIEGLGGHPPEKFPDFRADVWLLYDWSALYVAFICHDSQASHIVRSVTEEDSRRIFSNATAEIFFDADDDREDYYHIVSNALGTKYDAFVERVQQNSWDGTWDVAADLTDAAWTVEFRLPFRTFGITPFPGRRMGANFARCTTAEDGSRSEAAIWRGRFHVARQFGSLQLGSLVTDSTPDPAERRTIVEAMMRTVEKELDGEGRWHPMDLGTEAARERAQRLIGIIPAVRVVATPYLVWTCKAITNEHIYPWTAPIPEELDRPVRMSACPGEFESGTFSVTALEDLEGLEASITDLTDETGNRVPSGAIDLTIVKCWYQGGRDVPSRDADGLKAELLLHDDSIVDVDYGKRDNRLNFEYIPRDAATLQPVNVPAFESRQFWLTVHVPDETPPGDYVGSLRIRCGDSPDSEIPVRLRVHPFELAEPRLEYSVYYPKRVKGDTEEEQHVMWDFMLWELRDMVDHGITNPSTYVDTSPEHIRKLQELRELAGCKNDGPIYLVTSGVGYATSEKYLESVRNHVSATVRQMKKLGYSDVYFQGIDEAGAEKLLLERPGWTACREAGGKVFVAIGTDGVEVVADILDTAVVSGWVEKETVDLLRSHGNRASNYANPFMGYEVPETYRRYAGLSPWTRGLDGLMNWS